VPTRYHPSLSGKDCSNHLNDLFVPFAFECLLDCRKAFIESFADTAGATPGLTSSGWPSPPPQPGNANGMPNPKARAANIGNTHSLLDRRIRCLAGCGEERPCSHTAIYILLFLNIPIYLLLYVHVQNSQVNGVSLIFRRKIKLTPFISDTVYPGREETEGEGDH
jgi:hypothetical protein